ncbi:hypothetical protein KJ359_012203 [Pestalotiopsis sp. 9143b]|nr:hypothetical protein KJ359_012203 [Pestalotiopsis sp. 9143b]
MTKLAANTKLAATVAKDSNDTTMAETSRKPAGSTPPPVTYNNPRRTSPENSITLRHHRAAREASQRNLAKQQTVLAHKNKPCIPTVSITQSPRRNSSGESHETGASDPRQWYERSNQNLPVATSVGASMDIDPPFFQKESDGSSDEARLMPAQSPVYDFMRQQVRGLLRPGMTQSSSADDYRSVIDDLTVENKRLREELKRYRQAGPDSLRRDKLFEVKVHGLPSRKKRELEAALRDFTTSLDGSSAGTSSARRREKTKNKGLDSVMSKHASSSSGSNSRPNQTDSAYASMSTGGVGSSATSLPSKLSTQKSDNTVERYLADIPEGLLPNLNVMSESEKKKLVVRRLEQIFTGKGVGHARHNSLSLVPAGSDDVDMSGLPGADDDNSQVKTQAARAPAEACREAHILPRSQQKSHSYHNVSPSNSAEDQTTSRDTGDASGSGGGSGQRDNGVSPPDGNAPEQRPTRPNDLDPDRPSVPAENMSYISHLGLHAPESRQFSAHDVSVDTEGWVYLNLLCSMAQLHMFNVTPAFIRSAVNEKSKQFQLSPDGRKIRWRGGGEGTRFSSDSSGDNSQRGSTSPGDTDGSNEFDQRKRRKARPVGDEVIMSEPSKFAQQPSGSSDEFHYKPMFAHHQTSSSDEQPSLDDESGSSAGLPEESHLGMNSKWNYSGVSRQSQRKRRRDGAIIYYTGAPFCTDLSGDVSNDSAYNTGSSESPVVPELKRYGSGSSIPFKPLSNFTSHRSMMDLDFTQRDGSSDETDVHDELHAEFPWSRSTQSAKLTNLEASGLGGVAPDDHFVVIVATSRPKSVRSSAAHRRPTLTKELSEETTLSRDTAESMAGRLAALSTGSPTPTGGWQPRVNIVYLNGRVQHLPAAPLPPPSFFFGTAASSFETTTSGSSDGDDAQPGMTQSCAYSANGDLSSNDEEDEHDDDEGGDDDDEDDDVESDSESIESTKAVAPALGRHSSARVSDLSKMTTGSSVATAGGVISGYSSLSDNDM